MLKKFFLNFLSSFVATWVALGLFLITAVIVIVAMVGKAGISAASENVEKVKKHSVMTLELSGEIIEREQAPDLDYIRLLQGDVEAPQTLVDLVSAVREAADDKNIDMIYLKCQGVAAGPATLNALRQELLRFKAAGKKIYAYGDAMLQGDYYVASVADSLFINPGGSVAIHGIGGTTLFMKDLFDKIGVEFQIVKVGTFKSAVEPYIMNEMSAPARAQLDTLYGGMWKYIAGDIAKSRKMSVEKINDLINKDFIMVQEGDAAVRAGLVDKAVYERTMDARIARAIGVDEDDVNFVGVSTMAVRGDYGSAYASKDRVAVLFAEGEIREGTKNGINCEVLVPEIVRLADDDEVKSMVLRVNSPGGSVFGSDLIGEALAYFKSKGKKLIVSMGDYAASGGYWISCEADCIFADPLTITGSIGIFGMIPNAAGLASKVGIHPQSVTTNPDANFPSLFQSMNAEQMGAMQKMVERGYDKFVGRVAKGRRMPESKVRAIAEGRVWSAEKARELGLVDRLGGLQDAILFAAGDDKDPAVAFYPVVEPNGFMQLIQLSLRNQGAEALIREAVKLCPDAASALEVANTLRRRTVQARMMPMEVRL
ncbi:MAG: signal peptide peptidase SppA [Bacteroides sp.]|nr:signal peptide peptidase SppA [Bacteroides sp.]